MAPSAGERACPPSASVTSKRGDCAVASTLMNERSRADASPDPPARRTPGSPQPTAGEEADRNSSFDRRSFLRGVGAAAGVAGALALGGCSQATEGPPAPSSSKPSPPGRAPVKTVPWARKRDVHIGELDLPIADWLVEENKRPGTKHWLVTGTPHRGIEGWADHVSAKAGDVVTLYADSRAREVSVKVYRLGWYQGYGGRLVADLGLAKAHVQPEPTITPGVNMVECHWSPTMRFEVGSDWPPGYYVLRLGTSPQGWSQWVPLVIRDDSSRAALVVQSSVTTWQAYNLYGEYSLYLGPSGAGGTDVAHRPRRVLRQAVSARVGGRHGRSVRQRVSAAGSRREVRDRRDLLDGSGPTRAS